jgi:hypothetical protein
MKEFIRLAGVFYEGSLMAILKSVVVPKNSGSAFEIRRRRRLRIARKSIVDFVAFNPARFNRAVRSGGGQRESTVRNVSLQSPVLVSNRRRIQFKRNANND